jgi:hypothetical protein
MARDANTAHPGCFTSPGSFWRDAPIPFSSNPIQRRFPRYLGNLPLRTRLPSTPSRNHAHPSFNHSQTQPIAIKLRPIPG